MRIPSAVLLVLLAAARAGAQAPSLEPPPLWDVQIGASFVGTSGNSETTSTGADFAMHRRWTLWQIESTAAAVRTSDHDEVKAERYIGAIRGQRALSPIAAFSVGEKLERDRFAGIDVRSIADAGVNWKLVRAPRWTVDGITAIGWNHESRVVGAEVDDGIGLLQILSRVPFGTTGDTTQRFTAYPDFTNGAAYRHEAELTAQAALNNRLALKLGYLLRYSHAPVAGFKTTDMTTTASVVVRWRAAPPPAP
jgi:putative salt-induced outer membrane protein YdiY